MTGAVRACQVSPVLQTLVFNKARGPPRRGACELRRTDSGFAALRCHGVVPAHPCCWSTLPSVELRRLVQRRGGVPGPAPIAAQIPGPSRAWVDKITSRFPFERIVSGHFASPIASTPQDLRSADALPGPWPGSPSPACMGLRTDKPSSI